MNDVKLMHFNKCTCVVNKDKICLNLCSHISSTQLKYT